MKSLFPARRLKAATAFMLIALAAGPLDAQEPTPADSAAPAPVALETVVATVNGQPVTEADLQLALNDLDGQFAQLPPEARRAAALSAVIEIRVLAAQAEAAGLTEDPEFQRRMEFLRQRALHTELVEEEVAKKVTEEEIRARYDQEVANQPPVNEVKTRHILVGAKEEAEAIIRELDAGADFAELANQRTTDPSGKGTGGDLGWVSPETPFVEEFKTAALQLQPGSYTKEPVQSQFGFHVIKADDKRVRQPPAFEQVKEQVRSLLLREKYFALVKDLRDKAQVEIADPALKTALDQADAAQ